MKTSAFLSKKANSISIEITTACNLNCVYCTRKEKTQHMNDDLLKKLVQWIYENQFKRVSFCGIGESLLHPSFYSLKQTFKDIPNILVTNGSIPINTKFFKKTDIIIFSVDGATSEIVTRVCGKGYSFNVLLENLNKVQNMNVKDKPAIILLNCTINKYNIDYLSSIIELSKEYNISNVHFSLPWGAEEFIRKERQRIMDSLECAEAMAKKLQIFMENPVHSYCCIMIDSIMAYIDINGNYYSCPKLLYQNKRYFNIFKSPDILKQLTSKNQLKEEYCQTCQITKNLLLLDKG